MGRRSKAATARLNNLGQLETSRNLTIDDAQISDHDDGMNIEGEDLLEEGFFFLDEGDDSDIMIDEDSEGSESEDEGIDEDELDELQNEADIEYFNAVLIEAQVMAVNAEREAAGQKKSKRKRHYTGNLDRTKRYHAQKRRVLAATGQKLISTMFSTRKTSDLTTQLDSQGNTARNIIEIVDEASENDSESEDDGSDEINASLQRLFPNRILVSFLKLKSRIMVSY